MPSISDKKPILIATDNDEGQRLDNFLLKHKKQLDKASCYKLIRKGQIRVNGKRCKPLQKLLVGDQVRMPPFVFFVDEPTIKIPPQESEKLLKRILFEDADFLVLDKPAGLPCHKGSGHDYGVIEVIVSLPQYETAQLAHRLDKDTSGCLLLSKSRRALLYFQQALKQHEVNKTYLAVLDGKLLDPIEVNHALDTENRVNGIRHVVVSPSGQSALTRFKPIRHHSKYTLVQCEIETGRTHQIRVHAQSIHHAILGDRFYGRKQPALNRQLYLHAYKISFGGYLFEASIPVEFDQIMHEN